jgi:hypothetical protein
MLAMWIAALFWAAPEVAASEPPADSVQIRVRLYNYAEAPRSLLEKAKANASHLLNQTGLRLAWAECRRRAEDPPIDSACQLPLTPLDVELRVVNREMAHRLGSPGHRLGYAWLTPGLDSLAAVYFHRAVEFERDHGIDRGAVLGSIMAHELGHLLLDTSAHAASGLMRRSWQRGDLLRVAQGTLRFTRPEAARMREMLRKRAASCRPDPRR